MEIERPPWICCLSPAEFNILRTTSDIFEFTFYEGIPIETWDTLWVPVVRSRAARRAAFLELYSLEVVTAIIPPDGIEVTLIIPSNLMFWQYIGQVFAQIVPLCPDGCGYFVPA